MDDIYTNIEEYNPNKKQKYWSYLMICLLICFVIKKLNPKVTELFNRERKLNISLMNYFAVLKNIRLNSRHYFVMKIPSKFQSFNKLYSSDIDFEFL